MEILAYVGRHASTENNDSGKYRGHLELPLSDKGVHEAKETAEYLKTLRPTPNWVISSDLPSAKETARIYAKALNLKLMRPMKDLRGMDINGFAGKSKAEAEAELKECFRHPDKPCGKDGETPAHFDERCVKAFAAVCKIGGRTKTIPLIVTHGSNTVFLTKKDTTANYQEPPVKPGGLLKLTDTDAVPMFKVDTKAKPIPIYPSDHVAGMQVPKGGSNCLKCEYVDGQNCTNDYFIAWNGSNLIPLPVDSFCSDWFEPKKELHIG
jgi:broad specificity phosphatase PhoE